MTMIVLSFKAVHTVSAPYALCFFNVFCNNNIFVGDNKLKCPFKHVKRNEINSQNHPTNPVGIIDGKSQFLGLSVVV